MSPAGWPPALRRILPRAGGLRWLAECFLETPGSWLFRRPNSEWLGDSALVSQLPPSYRLFARFCSAQRGHPVGAELLLRFIIWLRRMARIESSCRLEIHGVSMFVNLSDPRFLVLPRELSTGLPRILKNFLRPGDTFVDVGSNHGTFAIKAAQLVAPHGLVVAIEPQARLADLIRRSLALQSTRFVVHNAACGQSTGTAPLYVPRATSGSSGLHPAFSALSRHEIMTVPVARLDDLLQSERLPGRVFVKIDIEGSEAACLAGAQDFLSEAQPPILMEINERALAAAGSSTVALAEALRSAGYDRYLGGREMDLEHALTAPITDSNIIALHRSRELSNLRAGCES